MLNEVKKKIFIKYLPHTFVTYLQYDLPRVPYDSPVLVKRST
jgi:hypothetical protein